MELDKYKNDGSFLLGTSSGLITTDGQTTSTLVSLTVTGFTQINTTHIALADRNSHCMKIMARDKNTTSVMAGSCGSKG